MARLPGCRAAVGVLLITLLASGCTAARHGHRSPAVMPFSGTPTAPSGVVLDRSNVHYGSGDDELADVYRPSGTTATLPAVLVVHGGGWISGSKADLSSLAGQVAEAGFVTVNIDYQLATEAHPGFPRQLHQLRQAVEWIRRNAASLHVDPARIGALGSSAGGNLVALLGTDAAGPLTRGYRIRAAAIWSAPLELSIQPNLTRAVGIYLGCTTNCATLLTDASPLHHISADDTPMAIFNSSAEMIPVAQAIMMTRMLRQDDVREQLTVFPGRDHAVEYARQALQPTTEFLKRQLA